ncbi:MAG: hypothetical protein EP343_04220 [Deltaproteobacteria bacterium]|nr:MAG: hypothetical protein EP343_04220 [Deltaproteobacteria bacterium]
MRVGVWFLIILGLGMGVTHCAPPDPPTPENPPCLEKLDPAPAANFTLKREGAVFKVTFSKLIQLDTLSIGENNSTVYLVSGEIDNAFISDMESPPLIDSRKSRLVKLKIEAQDVGDKTELTATALDVLQGDSTYYFVITRKVRDRLVDVGEGRFNGARALNFCADDQGIWRGSLDEFKAGRTEIFEFRTEPAPPRTGTPKIVEVMASPPTEVSSNGEYVEIINAHPSEPLDLCGLALGKDSASNSSARVIVPFDPDGSCRPLQAGERGVVIEPDYDKAANVYKIPGNVQLFTVVLSSGSRSTTLFSGNLSSTDSVVLWDGTDRLQSIDPQTVAGGDWPSSGKSLEKCNPDGANDTNNWKVSETGSAGQTPNSKDCP